MSVKATLSEVFDALSLPPSIVDKWRGLRGLEGLRRRRVRETKRVLEEGQRDEAVRVRVQAREDLLLLVHRELQPEVREHVQGLRAAQHAWPRDHVQ